MQFGGVHIGIGGAIVLLILSFVFKTNLFSLLGGGTGDPSSSVSQPDPARDAAEKPLVEFVSFVLDDAQKTWTQLLPQQTGKTYRHAKLVLFRNMINSGCGAAEEKTDKRAQSANRRQHQHDAVIAWHSTWKRTVSPRRQWNAFPNHRRFIGRMSAMEFCRVIVDLVQMNRRRLVVRRDRHIPLSRERTAHVSCDSV